MRSLVVVVACLAFPLVALAQPAVQPDELSMVDFDKQAEEPLGLVVKTDQPKLGLLRGDLLRTVNGVPVVERFHVISALASVPSVLHLELVRAGKPLSLKLAVTPTSESVAVARDQLRTTVADLRGTSGGSRLRGTTRQRQPAGVVLLDRLPALRLAVGDIVRKIDGKPVKTVEQVPALLEAGVANPKIVLELERAGVAFTLTLAMEDASQPADLAPDLQLELDKIEQTSETSRKIPKRLVDKLLANPMPFVKGARFVPAMKDGKPDGLKLYAIRQTSIFAKLGLRNGDTLQKINGMNLDSMDKGLEIYSKLRDTKQLTVELVRRGKPVTLTWTIQ